MDKRIIILVILVVGCINQKDEIAFTDLEEDLSCIFPLDMPEEMVITSQKEYEELLTYVSDSPTCQDFVLPDLDFSQVTLLGKHAYGVGCSITFERHVYRDTEQKKIIYSVTVIEEGCCEMLGMSMNWITIPTVPAGYTVVFEIRKKQDIVFLSHCSSVTFVYE
jgi:hypothetical protein